MTEHQIQPTGRRGIFAIGAAALLTGALPWAAMAQSDTTAPVRQLNDALLASMRSHAPFAQRYGALSPVVERAFDLPTVLARSVGPSWASVQPGEKAELEAAFLRYTVSSYASSFDSYNGQRFEVSPTVRAGGDGQTVVSSQLIRADGSPVELDYVVHQGPQGWQVVDVLMNGAISRVAVQRSDFRSLLRTGGVSALTASLRSKVANLAG